MPEKNGVSHALGTYVFTRPKGVNTPTIRMTVQEVGSDKTKIIFNSSSSNELVYTRCSETYSIHFNTFVYIECFFPLFAVLLQLNILCPVNFPVTHFRLFFHRLRFACSLSYYDFVTYIFTSL